jgi:crotonobetainyl-CoA:carnitine CoA-transferase CaiB-like acyl-CoA transferase
MFGAIAIASALAGRASEAKVRPVYLDISMYDSMISWLTFQAGIFFATGENPKRLGSAHPLLVPYQAFKAKDRHFILAVGNDAIWIRVCEAIGAEDLANDTRFKTVSARVVNREKLIPILDRIFEKENSDHWLSLFDQAGVPCSPIASVGEALWSNHSKRRRLVMNLRQTGGNIVRSISSPITFNNGKKIRSRNFAPPSLGENSREVLLSFGFSKREIGELQEQQIVPKVK